MILLHNGALSALERFVDLNKLFNLKIIKRYDNLLKFYART